MASELSFSAINVVSKNLAQLEPKLLTVEGKESGIALDPAEVAKLFPYVMAQDGTVRYDLLSLVLLSEIKNLNRKFNTLVTDYKLTKSSNSAELVALRQLFENFEKTIQKYLNV